MIPEPIPIRLFDADSVQNPRDCNACLQAPSPPLCQASALPEAQPPRLNGPPEQLQRVLEALMPRLGGPDGQLDGRLVRSVDVLEGEIHLHLAVSRHCVGAELLNDAFQALRQSTPDTDIYVPHAPS
jgi:hypothetical protein